MTIGNRLSKPEYRCSEYKVQCRGHGARASVGLSMRHSAFHEHIAGYRPLYLDPLTYPTPPSPWQPSVRLTAVDK